MNAHDSTLIHLVFIIHHLVPFHTPFKHYLPSCKRFGHFFKNLKSGQKYTTFCPVFPPKMHSGTSFMVSFKNFIAMFWEFNPETNQYCVWKWSARLEKPKSQKPEGFFLLHNEF